jgi:hypothetical protein
MSSNMFTTPSYPNSVKFSGQSSSINRSASICMIPFARSNTPEATSSTADSRPPVTIDAPDSTSPAIPAALFFLFDTRLMGRRFADVGTWFRALPRELCDVGSEYRASMPAWNAFSAYLATNDAGRIPWKISSTKSCSISNPAPTMPTSFRSAIITWIMYLWM